LPKLGLGMVQRKLHARIVRWGHVTFGLPLQHVLAKNRLRRLYAPPYRSRILLGNAYFPMRLRGRNLDPGRTSRPARGNLHCPFLSQVSRLSHILKSSEVSMHESPGHISKTKRCCRLQLFLCSSYWKPWANVLGRIFQRIFDLKVLSSQIKICSFLYREFWVHHTLRDL
jgi:hypothetical protein